MEDQKPVHIEELSHPYPRCLIDKESIRRELGKDMYYRKQRKWPLVQYYNSAVKVQTPPVVVVRRQLGVNPLLAVNNPLTATALPVVNTLIPLARTAHLMTNGHEDDEEPIIDMADPHNPNDYHNNEYQKAYPFGYNNNNTNNNNNAGTNDESDDDWTDESEEYVNPHLYKTETEALEKLKEDFSFAQVLLDRHRGKLALCGGAIYNICSKTERFRSESGRDADFFFYNCTEDEATEILIDCVSTIVELANPEKFSEDLQLNIRINEQGRMNDNDMWMTESVRVERAAKYTNVTLMKYNAMSAVFFGKTQRSVIYQFIHRIYPSFDSILGGFDVPLSMFGYDGNHIYSTPIGNFCARHNIIIADLSRRSETFERRLIKYQKRSESPIIFPGLNYFGKRFRSDFYEQTDMIFEITILIIAMLKIRRRENDWYDQACSKEKYAFDLQKILQKYQWSGELSHVRKMLNSYAFVFIRRPRISDTFILSNMNDAEEIIHLFGNPNEGWTIWDLQEVCPHDWIIKHFKRLPVDLGNMHINFLGFARWEKKNGTFKERPTMYSDYSDYENGYGSDSSVKKQNSSSLISGNVDGVRTFVSYKNPVTKAEVIKNFKSSLKNPRIEVSCYSDMVKRYNAGLRLWETKTRDNLFTYVSSRGVKDSGGKDAICPYFLSYYVHVKNRKGSLKDESRILEESEIEKLEVRVGKADVDSNSEEAILSKIHRQNIRNLGPLPEVKS